MKKLLRRTWRQALDAAAARDATEGTEGHSNDVLLRMIASLPPKRSPGDQAEARYNRVLAKSVQLAVFVRPKGPRAKPAAILFTSAKLPRGGRP